jgi:hypothetical protein
MAYSIRNSIAIRARSGQVSKYRQGIDMALSRRDSLKLGAIGLSAAATRLGAKVGSGELRNILLLVSEDNNPYIGAYGDKFARTPNIDALARKAILYRNAYSDAPVCAPSRFAMLTGINPESCSPAQHMRAEAKLPEGFRTYPEPMRQAGYFCINNPKTDYNCTVDPAKLWDIQGIEGHWRKAPKGETLFVRPQYRDQSRTAHLPARRRQCETG